MMGARPGIIPKPLPVAAEAEPTLGCSSCRGQKQPSMGSAPTDPRHAWMTHSRNAPVDPRHAWMTHSRIAQ